MSFGGQSSAEKQQDSIIKGNQTQIGDIATDNQARGDKTFKFFKQSAKPAMDYWKGILSGDSTAISEFLGPELSNISNVFGNERKSLSEFSPRGGARASGNVDLAAKEAGATGDAILKARPAAAEHLSSLAGLFGSESLGFSDSALKGLGASADIGFGLNKEQEAIRARQAQMWASLGQAAGMVAASVINPAGTATKTATGGATNGPFGKF